MDALLCSGSTHPAGRCLRGYPHNATLWPRLPSRQHERQQRPDIVAVGGFQEGDVVRSQFTHAGETSAAPTIARAAELLDQRVCYQPCAPAIAIWKWMYCHQSVMQPHGYIVDRMGCVLHPIPHIAGQVSDFDGNPIGFDADIAFRLIALRRSGIVSYLNQGATNSGAEAAKCLPGFGSGAHDGIGCATKPLGLVSNSTRIEPRLPSR